MNLNAFRAWRPAYQNILADKVSLTLAIIPVLIGVILYLFMGQYYFSSLIGFGQTYIEQYLSDGALGKILYYVVAGILTVGLYFIVNWTFVLVISIIASPFNELLSSRIEKRIQGKALPSLADSFQGIFSKIFSTLMNECKKMVLILGLSILALLFGFFPPISILITALLLSIGYVDYSWARHDMVFKECKTDLRKNIFSYGIGGGIFMILISIPFINLFVPSLATSYFTILWMKNNEHRYKAA